MRVPLEPRRLHGNVAFTADPVLSKRLRRRRWGVSGESQERARGQRCGHCKSAPLQLTITETMRTKVNVRPDLDNRQIVLDLKIRGSGSLISPGVNLPEQ